MTRVSRQIPPTFGSARTFLRPNRLESGEPAVEVSAIEAAVTGDRDLTSPGYASLQIGFVFVWLFTFMIYARPEDMFPALAPFHLTLICGTAATVICGGALFFRRVFVPFTIETRLIVLLTAWFVAGVPFAFWKTGSLEVLTHVWLKTVLVYLLLTLTLQTLDRIHAVVWAILLSELVATAFSIFQPSKSLWVGERIYGANVGFLGWNFLGIAAAMTIPYIAAIFILRRSALTTCLLIATSLSTMWMLILTASRGGFLNVIFSVVLTSLLVLRGSSRGRVAAIGIIVVLLVATMCAPPVFWSRLGTMWDSSGSPTFSEPVHSGLEQLAAEESTEGRLLLLKRSVQYTFEHPVFGVGLGNFNLVSGSQHGTESNAWMGTHNTFTQISSEAGLPALALYLMLLMTILRDMYQIRRRSLKVPDGQELSLMAGATLVSVLAFVFGACVAHLGYDYYFFYIVAIAAAVKRVAGDTFAETDEMRRDGMARLRLSPIQA